MLGLKVVALLGRQGQVISEWLLWVLACCRTCLRARVASPNLVSMLINDEEGDDALVPSNALIRASPRRQCLVVESVEAAEDDLA